jgi:hypothetical protein
VDQELLNDQALSLLIFGFLCVGMTAVGYWLNTQSGAPIAGAAFLFSLCLLISFAIVGFGIRLYLKARRLAALCPKDKSSPGSADGF